MAAAVAERGIGAAKRQASDQDDGAASAVWGATGSYLTSPKVNLGTEWVSEGTQKNF